LSAVFESRLRALRLRDILVGTRAFGRTFARATIACSRSTHAFLFASWVRFSLQ
jgi:hypothetical protein